MFTKKHPYTEHAPVVINLKAVELLLNAQADPNLSNNQGRTPLQIASYNGHLQVVKSLLQAQTDPNTSDDHGKTPLHLARAGRHSKIILLSCLIIQVCMF